MSRKTNLNYS